MIRLKDPSINLVGIKPETNLVIKVVDDAICYQFANAMKVNTITSMVRTSTRISLHDFGFAFDIRTKDWYKIHSSEDRKAAIENVVSTIKDFLGNSPDVDVIAEKLNTAHEHIHVEVHPKRQIG